MEIYVGTSGFQYKEWAKHFYENVPKKSWLDFYAGEFNTVELNVTFYRLPTVSAFQKWYRETPPGFRFAVKGSRYLTHQKRLLEPEDGIKNLFDRAAHLGEKLGVVLWQLPASFRRNDDRLENFIKALAAHSVAGRTRQAIEFRHASWFNEGTYQILRRYNVALVIAHSQRWPYATVVTADFTYLRFHGAPKLYASNYGSRSLENWAKFTKTISPVAVYAYFNNDMNVHAPENAKYLQQALESI